MRSRRRSGLSTARPQPGTGARQQTSSGARLSVRVRFHSSSPPALHALADPGARLADRVLALSSRASRRTPACRLGGGQSESSDNASKGADLSPAGPDPPRRSPRRASPGPPPCHFLASRPRPGLPPNRGLPALKRLCPTTRLSPLAPPLLCPPCLADCASRAFHLLGPTVPFLFGGLLRLIVVGSASYPSSPCAPPPSPLLGPRPARPAPRSGCPQRRSALWRKPPRASAGRQRKTALIGPTPAAARKTTAARPGASARASASSLRVCPPTSGPSPCWLPSVLCPAVPAWALQPPSKLGVQPPPRFPFLLRRPPPPRAALHLDPRHQ